MHVQCSLLYFMRKLGLNARPTTPSKTSPAVSVGLFRNQDGSLGVGVAVFG